MSYSLNALYRVLGTSKQAVHQSKKRQIAFDKELCVLVKAADALKREHPGCGVEKMYYTLKPKTMGRDKFCEIFLKLGYGVKKIKNYRRTTVLGHISYPNLIAGLEVESPGRVVQTDITYFALNQSHYYLVFILDVYTREIVGYHVGDHLHTEANIKALEMALAKIEISAQGLIHHSDRGSQYGSTRYRNKLKKKGIQISMGLTALENAYAERVNGIIKNEYLSLWDIKDLINLKRKTKQAVAHYNTKRKHRGHQMKYTPSGFKQMWLHLNPQDRPKVTIYTEGKTNLIGASSPNEISPRAEPQAPNCPMDFNLVVT